MSEENKFPPLPHRPLVIPPVMLADNVKPVIGSTVYAVLPVDIDDVPQRIVFAGTLRSTGWAKGREIIKGKERVFTYPFCAIEYDPAFIAINPQMSAEDDKGRKVLMARSAQVYSSMDNAYQTIQDSGPTRPAGAGAASRRLDSGLNS